MANEGDNAIRKYSPKGELLKTITGKHLDEPTGIAFDEGGNFYVVNHGNNTVVKFSPKGENLGEFISMGLNKPTYIAILPASKLSP